MKLKNLPAGQYNKISTTYIPLVEGMGATCENCGRLIANIVTVKHEGGKHYTIGQDCAKTLFTDAENKQINFEIKEEKRRQANEKKAAVRLKRVAAFQELHQLEREAGINNSNINEQWTKDIYNKIVDIISAKYLDLDFSFYKR